MQLQQVTLLPWSDEGCWLQLSQLTACQSLYPQAKHVERVMLAYVDANWQLHSCCLPHSLCMHAQFSRLQLNIWLLQHSLMTMPLAMPAIKSYGPKLEAASKLLVCLQGVAHGTIDNV